MDHPVRLRLGTEPENDLNVEFSFVDNVHLHRKLLRAGNLEVQGTISVLRSFLQMINGYPLYFENVLPFEKSDPVWDERVMSTPPVRDQHGRRLFLMRAGAWNPDKIPFSEASSGTCTASKIYHEFSYFSFEEKLTTLLHRFSVFPPSTR